MSEATSGTKLTLASDFALRAPGYASCHEQNSQAGQARVGAVSAKTGAVFTLWQSAGRTSGTFLLSQKCLERFNRRCGVSKHTLFRK
jgi:hypothetical protein